MRQNSSEHYTVTCMADYPICWDLVTEVILVLENVTIILINLVHCFAIHKLLKKNRNTFKMIVFATSLVDVIFTGGWLLGNTCIFRTIISKDLASGVVGSTFSSLGSFLRFNMLALQSIERAYALKFPFSYGSSFLVKHSRLTIILLWTFTIVSLNCLYLPLFILGGRLCIDVIFGIIIEQPISLVLVNIMLVIPVTMTITCIVIIALELRKLVKSQTESYRENFSISVYIILSALAFMTSLLPVVFRIILVNTGLITESIHFQIITAVLFPLYGLINTVLYALFSPAYRQQVRDTCSCLHRVNP